jgi:energy-converting hydrogenase Eha subunit A
VTLPWQQRFAIVLGSAAATVLLLTLAGFITTMQYNGNLGLSDFVQESPFRWPYWGARSMVLPLVAMGTVAIAISLLSTVCRAGIAMCRPLRRVTEQTLARIRRMFEGTEWAPTTTLAPALLVLNIATLALVSWRFSDLLNGLFSFTAQSPEHLATLGPLNSAAQVRYRQILSAELFVFGLAWYHLVRLRHQRGDRGGLSSFAGGAAVMLLTFCLLAAPYRIVNHNQSERVSYASQTCYLLGQRSDEALLFCPLQPPPWNRVVKLHDPALQRGQTVENIFTEVGRSR